MQQQQKLEFHQKYDIVARLGKGQFATVYELLEKETGLRWAGKVVNKTAFPASSLEAELNIMAMIDHPNAVKLKEVFNTDDVCIIVQELITGGELFDRISNQGVFTEQYAAKFFRDLLLVVKYFHDLGIVHRDLKPENILMSDRSDNAILKLIDFGVSKFAAHDKAITGMRGTPPYMAPEIFAYASYGKPVDMWALGVILYIILSGMFPYDHEEKKFDCPFMSPEFDDISDSAKDILLKLLDSNPDTRVTVDNALAHPWVTGEKASNATMSMSHLRSMVARRKFKRTVETIRLLYRFKIVLRGKNQTIADQAASEERRKKKEQQEQIGKIATHLDEAENNLKLAVEKLNLLAKAGNAETSGLGKEMESTASQLETLKHNLHVIYLQLKITQTDLHSSTPSTPIAASAPLAPAFSGSSK